MTASTIKATLPHSALNHFLKTSRQSFLSSGASNDSPPPSIVMGNEAGDLDSLACSIAFSYLSSLSNKQVYPLIQTYRRDLHLRPENQLALQSCLIDPDNLICLEDLEQIHDKVGKLSLVDHNRLSSRFKNRREEDVEAIIDHHDDEKLYQSAKVREIVPPTSAGSCASILSLHFRFQLSKTSINILDKFPAELATLLLSAIIIDTHGLDPKVGKAKPDDQGAVGFLYPISSLSKQAIPSTSRTSQSERNTDRDDDKADPIEPELYVPSFPDLNSFHEALSEAKNDVSGLNTVDLIRRDYKEYVHPSPNSSTWTVGLTSVPTSLRDWSSKESTTSFLAGCHEFLSSKSLDLLGILTAFVDPKDSQFKREILFFSSEKAKNQSEHLCRVLEESTELELKEIEVEGLSTSSSITIQDEAQRNQSAEHWYKIYDQQRLKATRKQVAPAVKDACSKVEAPVS